MDTDSFNVLEGKKNTVSESGTDYECEILLMVTHHRTLAFTVKVARALGTRPRISVLSVVSKLKSQNIEDDKRSIFERLTESESPIKIISYHPFCCINVSTSISLLKSTTGFERNAVRRIEAHNQEKFSESMSPVQCIVQMAHKRARSEGG